MPDEILHTFDKTFTSCCVQISCITKYLQLFFVVVTFYGSLTVMLFHLSANFVANQLFLQRNFFKILGITLLPITHPLIAMY
jgi:hypothetical protein